MTDLQDELSHAKVLTADNIDLKELAEKSIIYVFCSNFFPAELLTHIRINMMMHDLESPTSSKVIFMEYGGVPYPHTWLTNASLG
jgi:hypothetical protein